MARVAVILIKIWRCRLYDVVVNVRILYQSRAIATPNLNSVGYDVMKLAILANHGSDSKESGHFAAVRALIRLM
jgi:hypothetical protein